MIIINIEGKNHKFTDIDQAEFVFKKAKENNVYAAMYGPRKNFIKDTEGETQDVQQQKDESL